MKTTEELISDLIEQRDEAQCRLDELSNEMVYRGNSVSYIYSKAENYKRVIDRCWDAVKEFGVAPNGDLSIDDAIRVLARHCLAENEKPHQKVDRV